MILQEVEMDHVESNATDGFLGAQLGKIQLNIHGPEMCNGNACPFHAPSDHSMVSWDTNVRLDKFGLVERLCEHGVGHPDPDSVAYYDSIGKTGMGIHGCDTCCWSG